MPRTADEIVRHADELAAGFDCSAAADPDVLDPEAVSLLRGAVATHGRAERHLIAAVTAARRSGMSWAVIGHFLGTSGEAARQRYAARVT